MEISRANTILDTKEKCNVWYDNRYVWIQSISGDTAHVSFIDTFVEEDVLISDLIE